MVYDNIHPTAGLRLVKNNDGFVRLITLLRSLYELSWNARTAVKKNEEGGAYDPRAHHIKRRMFL